MADAAQAADQGRCPWCGTDPLYVAYHDEEWGVPERDGRALFEKLILDGFQAGLAWITILRKRDAFRAGFDGFDPEKIARYGEPEIQRLLADPGIVRHRGKIEATIAGARLWLDMGGAEPFSRFLWGFVGDSPFQNAPVTPKDVPTETAESREMSKALKAKGFRFCGPTIVYAFMQATGLVNDHIQSCPAQERVRRLALG